MVGYRFIDIAQFEGTSLCAEVYPANATKPVLAWSSNDENVVVVDDNGNVCAIGSGSAIITAAATDGSGVTACCSVAVCKRYNSVYSVTLNPKEVVLEKGQTCTVCAEVCPVDASNPYLSWCSSNDAVATVCDGVITAVGNGTAVITATAMDGSGCSDCCTVMVNESFVPVTSVTVTPARRRMDIGDAAYVYKHIMPANATNKCVLWSSCDPDVAAVNPISGLVTALSEGCTVVYAAAQDGSGKQGCCDVTVKPPVHVECVSVSPIKKTMSIGDIILMAELSLEHSLER